MRKLSAIYILALFVLLLFNACRKGHENPKYYEIDLERISDSFHHYRLKDMAKSKFWSDSLMNLATNHHDSLWIIEAFRLQGVALIDQRKLPESTKHLTTLLSNINKAKYASEVITIHQNIASSYLLRGLLDSASHHYEKIFRSEAILKDPSLLAKLQVSKAELEQRKGNSDEALRMFLEAAKFINEDVPTEENKLPFIYWKIGIILMDKGDYDGVLEYLNKCISKAQKFENKKIEAYAKDQKSLLFQNIGEMNEAKKLQKEVLSLTKIINDPQLDLLSRIHGIFIDYLERNNRKADSLFNEIRMELKDNDRMVNLSGLYIGTAQFWIDNENFHQSLKTLVQGIEYIGILELNIPDMQSSYFSTFCEAFLNLNKLSETNLVDFLRSFLSSTSPQLIIGFIENLAIQSFNSQQWETAKQFYKVLSIIKHQQGDKNQAFFYLSRSNSASDSLEVVLKKNTVDKLMVMEELILAKEDSFAKEKEIQKQLNAQKNRRIYNLFLIIVSLLCIIAISYFVRQNKHKTILNSSLEKRNAEIAEKNEIISKDQERIQNELQQNQKLLIKETLYKQRINELAKGIRDSFKSFKNTGDISVFEDLTKEIRISEIEINESDDMLLHYIELESDFIDKIKNIHPNIKDNDIKHIAYIRMNLNPKEVGPILGISARSVESARYRLKKKLGLNNEVSLLDYIHSI